MSTKQLRKTRVSAHGRGRVIEKYTAAVSNLMASGILARVGNDIIEGPRKPIYGEPDYKRLHKHYKFHENIGPFYFVWLECQSENDEQNTLWHTKYL